MAGDREDPQPPAVTVQAGLATATGTVPEHPAAPDDETED